MALTDQEIDEIIREGLQAPVPTQELSPTPAQKPPGRFKSLVQSVAKPFLRFGGTAIKAGSGAVNLGQAAIDKVQGDEAGVQRNIQEAAKAVQNTPINFGYLGPEVYAAKGMRDAVGVGLELGSYGVGGTGVVRAGGSVMKGLALQATLRGAATGAATGAVSGAGQALQEDKGAAGVASEAIVDAAAGGLGGAALGALSGGLAKFIRPRVISDATKHAEEIDELTKIVSPKLTKRRETEALIRAGKPGGVAEEGGRLIRTPTAYERKMAEAVQDIVKPNQSVGKNLHSLNREIAFVGSKMEEELAKTPGIFNNNQLKKVLQDVEPDISIQADPVLERQHSLIIERFFRFLDKQPNTKLGLWKARQEFDDFLDTQVKGMFDPAKNSAAKSAAMKVRNTVNEYILEGLPPESEFSKLLQREALMYRARMNIAEKAVGKVGWHKLKRYFEDHPHAKSVLWLAGTTVGGSALLGTLDALGGD